MTFEEKQMLLRRITVGKLYARVNYGNQYYNVVFSDPSPEQLLESDFIYQNQFSSLKDDGIFTIEESYTILRDQGHWNDLKETELKELREDIKTLHSKLALSKFNKTEQKLIKTTIEQGKKKIGELNHSKNQLYISTVEFLAEKARRRFLIPLISKLFSPLDDKLLEIPAFIDRLIVYYFEEDSVQESQIREIARSDPFRLYWSASRNTGTPLFNKSATEFSDLQYSLVLWAKIYDFAFESQNRPNNDIIEWDESFDAWYTAESNKLEKESQKNRLSQYDPGKPGNVEIFIPCSDKESLEEIYNQNSMESKVRIASRIKALEKAGGSFVKESDMPDTKQQIILQANRESSAVIMNKK